MDHILQTHEIVKTDFERGENCILYDSKGKTYLDFESGIWAAPLGHAHPRINRVIKNQVEKVMHLGTRVPNALAETAAVDVLQILGMNGGKCLFLSSGSEAVEFAAQTIRAVTGKKKLLTFTNSYLAAYGSAGKKDPNEWLVFDWSGYDDGDHSILSGIDFDSLGGFVFEPGGSGMGFVKFPPKSLVIEIAHKIKAAGGLLSVNEVTTGMGRTGKWFGFFHYDLEPDIAATGKGLGNGYPISAVAMLPEIAKRFEHTHPHYAQSHQNDPLGCAVASEVIAVIQEDGLIERGKQVGIHFLGGLERLVQKHAVLKGARGRGPLLALEFNPHENINASSMYHALFAAGYLVGHYDAGNILRFDPPLTIEINFIDRLLSTLDNILDSL